MIMYIINQIAIHLEEEKSKLIDLERKYESAGNLEPGERMTFIRNISEKKGAIDTLIRLLEKVK